MNRTHGEFTLRAQNDNELIVEGYALKWDTETLLFETGKTKVFETIQRGAILESAFENTLYNKNHKDDLTFARVSNGTLECVPDDVGIWVRASLVNTQAGRDHYEEVKSRLLDKMSFRWRPRYEKVETTQTRKNGFVELRRVIKSISKIEDVSAVVIPAYKDTEIYARANQENSDISVSRETRDEILKDIEKRNKAFHELKNKIY